MPSVLIEVGFISNQDDLKTMRSPEGRDKIAGNLLKAFSTFKSRYDGSTGSSVENTAAEPPSAPEVEAEAPVAAGESGVTYGVQVLATSRKMSADDKFFGGYPVKEVKAGTLYKYLLRPVSDEAEARRFYKNISRNYPGCFLVRIEGDSLERLR